MVSQLDSEAGITYDIPPAQDLKDIRCRWCSDNCIWQTESSGTANVLVAHGMLSCFCVVVRSCLLLKGRVMQPWLPYSI